MSKKIYCAKFTEWNQCFYKPFCEILQDTEEIEGDISEIEYIKAMIMKDKGFKSDDFTKPVFAQVKAVEKDFRSKMQSFKKSRNDITNKMCFSIDSKGARAIDDVISVEKVQDSEALWKIGIHIADVADFVAKNKPTDKAAQANVESKYIGKHFFK